MNELISVVDADDLILKTRDSKMAYMDQHYSGKESITNIKSYDRTTLVPIIGLKFYEEMNSHIKSRGPTLATPPLEGALDGIKDLSELIRIHVLSARTPEETQFVREWLEMYGLTPYIIDVSSVEDPQYDNVPEVSGKKKFDVASHLGASLFVDDDERHMPDEQVDGLRSLLFGEGEREDIAPHIIIARTWEDILIYARQLLPLQYT